MTRLVVDASALVLAVTDRSPAGHRAREVITGVERHAPHLVDAEVANVLRRMVVRRNIEAHVADRARRLAERSVTHRHLHAGPLAARAWQLIDNLTFYDALYVALAESLGASLVTSDQRLARAAPEALPLLVI